MLPLNSAITSLKRPLTSDAEAVEPNKRRATDDSFFEQTPVFGVSKLPPEMMVSILRHLEPGIPELLKWQRVSHQFAKVAQDQEFWQRYAPEIPKVDRPRNADFLAFQNRMRHTSGPNKKKIMSLLKREQSADLQITAIMHRNPKNVCRSKNFDVVRAQGAVQQVFDETTLKYHALFRKDPAIAQYLAFAGIASAGLYDASLHNEQAFMLNAVRRNVENFVLRGDGLAHSDAFERLCFQANGAMYRYATPEQQHDIKFALDCIRRWRLPPILPVHMRTGSPFLPRSGTRAFYSEFYRIAPSLQSDVTILRACLKQGLIDGNYFRYVAGNGLWQSDEEVMRLLSAESRGPEQHRDLFLSAHSTLRDQEQFALDGVQMRPDRVSGVSARLQNDMDWLMRAIAANRNVYLKLPFAQRQLAPLFHTYRHPFAIAEFRFWGEAFWHDRNLILENIHSIAAEATTSIFDLRDLSSSIIAKIPHQLRYDRDFVKHVLTLNPIEFDDMVFWMREEPDLRNVARRAVLANIKFNRGALQSGNHVLRPDSVPAFLRPDIGFAKHYLSILPDAAGRFSKKVRDVAEVMQISRLGLLLAADDERRFSTHRGHGIIQQLTATARRFEGDYLLTFAKTAYLASFKNWALHGYALRAVLQEGAQIGSTISQRNLAFELEQTFPVQGATVDSPWQRGLFTLAEQYFGRLLDVAKIDQAER